MSKPSAEEGGYKLVCENRKARFNYHVIDTFEAGLVLTGSEIKSIRQNLVSIAESWVRPSAGAELLVVGMSITQYSFNSARDYDATRPRKLLLHKKELNTLIGGVERKSLTIVPLKLYLKNGYAKLLIALAKGKSAPDKRDSIKKREANREAERAMKSKR